MRATVIHNIEQRISAYADFISAIDGDDLTRKLDIPRNKSVAEHLWCIVGARESYAKALAVGEWQGFSCSMKSYDRESFKLALESSGQTLIKAIEAVPDWLSKHDELLAAIAEHEVMHEGQIIRHMYGLGRELPASWRWA